MTSFPRGFPSSSISSRRRRSVFAGPAGNGGTRLMTESKTTALAVIENFTPAVLDREAMMEELEGLELTFDRVKIPSGGGLAFEIPLDDDEVDTVKEIVGVIVDHHRVNAYWPAAFSGQGGPPVCSSVDGKTGVALPEAEVAWAGRENACATCPFNQFGSADDGTGKACKNMVRLYVLREGEAFPLMLTLPPTSIRNWASSLAKRVLGRGLRPHQVVTRIGLKREQSRSGIAYSQATFKLAGVLSTELQAQMYAYSQSIKRATRGLGITSEDYEVTGASDDEEDAPF